MCPPFHCSPVRLIGREETLIVAQAFISSLCSSLSLLSIHSLFSSQPRPPFEVNRSTKVPSPAKTRCLAQTGAVNRVKLIIFSRSRPVRTILFLQQQVKTKLSWHFPNRADTDQQFRDPTLPDLMTAERKNCRRSSLVFKFLQKYWHWKKYMWNIFAHLIGL